MFNYFGEKFTRFSRFGSSEPQEPSAPSEITNFSATDDEIGQITFTYSNATGYPKPTYNLYKDDSLVETGVVSGDSYTVSASTADYKVLATNSEGSTYSNTDSGTSISDGSTTLLVSLDGELTGEI